MVGVSPVRSVVNVTLRPARFLRNRPPTQDRGIGQRMGVLARALVFLVGNYLLFAVPVAVGYSAIIGEGVTAAVFFLAIPFTLLTLLTILAFHAALVLTGHARGLVSTVQTVSATVGVYLSLALGFAFPVLLSEGVLGEFLRGVTLYLFVFDGEGALAIGRAAVVLAVVAGGYYAYSLYPAARVRYRATRAASTVIALATLTAPVFVIPWLTSPAVLPATLYSPTVYITGAAGAIVVVFAVLADLTWRTLP